MYKNSSIIERAVRDICMSIKTEGRKVLKDYDISPAQFDVLQILYFEGQKKLSAISKSLGVTKSTTTGLIKRLEILNLLTKEQSEKDKRVFYINITEEGKKIIENVIARRVELVDKVYEKMGKDEKLVEILSILAKNLKEVVKSNE